MKLKVISFLLIFSMNIFALDNSERSSIYKDFLNSNYTLITQVLSQSKNTKIDFNESVLIRDSIINSFDKYLDEKHDQLDIDSRYNLILEFGNEIFPYLVL